MTVNKETVLEWLSKHHHSREWLADQCGVKVAAVGNWIGKNAVRDIPSKAVLIIEGLMGIDAARTQASSTAKQNLVLEFNQEDFDNICTKAAEDKESVIPRKWAEKTLIALAGDDIEAIAEFIKAKQQAIEKQSSGGDHSTARDAS